MKTRILKAILAVLLIIVLTMANFLLLAVNVVTYAVDNFTLDNKTDNKNVEFMAYFKNGSGNNVQEYAIKINEPDIKIVMSVAVKQEGYFNGEIILENSNFKFKTEATPNERIKSISSNKIELNQINAGETIEIEVGIELLTTDTSFEVSLLNKESLLKLSGIYRDSEQKDISVKGERTVKLQLLSPYDESVLNEQVKLQQTVLTNKTFQYNGIESRIVQVQIESILQNNLYPVKTSKLELTAPTLQGNYPKTVMIKTPEALVTNGKTIEESDYTYDVTTGKIQIITANPETEGKVTWNKTGTDRYIVTYIFEGTDLPEEQQIKASSEILLYDQSQTTIKVNSENTLPAEERDTSIYVGIQNKENEIYKGKLYAGIDREIIQNIGIEVNLENIADNIVLVEDFENMNLSNIYTKTITINKEECNKILGESGIISILDKSTGSLIEQVTKDTQVDEKQNFVITVPEATKEIVIETSKPIQAGILNMTTTKVIKANEKATVQAVSQMEYVVHTSYKIGQEQKQLADATSKIILQETQTSAELTLSKTEYSTVTTNENVEIRAVLHSNSEKDELYKDPHVKITLPEEFETIEITSVKILNGEEFTVKDAHLQDKTIDIQFEGEQTTYKEQAIDGVTISILANLSTNKKQKSVDRQIVLTYENQGVINYSEGGTIGTDVKDIHIISQGGVIAISEIQEYGIQTVNGEGNTTAKLSLVSGEKTTTVTSEIINNQEQTISQMVVLGTFPTQKAFEQNTIKTSVGELQISKIDSTKVHVYYSENANATADLVNTSNVWQETITDPANVKKYLVIVDQFEVDEEFQFEYDVTIPANLEYNEVASLNYTVAYTTQQNVEQNVGTLALETGKGPVVETELKTIVGGQEVDSAKEGEKIEYSITAKNTGSEAIQDLQLTGKVPEGTVYVTEVKPTGIDGEATKGAFDEHPEQTEVTFTGIALQPGEEITKTYTVKIKKGTAQNNTIANTIVSKYGEIQKNSNTVTTKITEGKLEVDIKTIRGGTYIGEVETAQTGYSYCYLMIVKNISDQDIKNIKLQVDIQGMSIIELAYAKNEELQTFENVDNVVIDEIKAGETQEVSVSVLLDKFKDVEYKKVTLNATATAENITYHGNQKSMLAKTELISITNISTNKGQYVKPGEDIVYQIEVKNQGENVVEDVKIVDYISKDVTFVSIKSNGVELTQDQYKIGASVDDVIEDGKEITIEGTIDGNSSKTYVITVHVDDEMYNEEAIEISNIAILYSKSIEVERAKVTHILEPYKGENSGNGDDVTNQEKLISGVAWLDENENGERDNDEEMLNGITAKLLNVENNEYQTNSKGEIIQAVTNENGMYTLEAPKGKYVIIFEFDDRKYELTAYQKEGVSADKSSKVFSKEMKIDGTTKTVATTEVVTIADENISFMNIGLKERTIYDMKLEKTISRVIVQNSKGTETTIYEDAKLAKVEVNKKLLDTTKVIVEYKIKVTNEGDVAGYVKRIEDYMSSDYKFNSSMNPKWYQSGEHIYCDSLANTIIEPGESKEVMLTLIKQMTVNNTGLVNNTAEIIESSNEEGIKDIDSVGGNRQNGEDDMSSADLIVGVKTGGVVIVTIIITIIAILVVGAYIIIRKLSIKKEI